MITPAKTLLAALGVAALLGTAGAASAETRFDTTHPARAEVNMRLHTLDHRVVAARHEGRIGPAKAKLMRAELRRIRREERMDAARHGGRLTKVEHRTLNREANLVGHQVRP